MNSVGSLNKSARSNFSGGGASRRSDGTGSQRGDGGGNNSVKTSRSGTSSGRERRSSCTSEGTPCRSSSRSRPRSRPRGREEENTSTRDRARSKSRDGGRAPSVGRNGSRTAGGKSRPRKEYEAPFDSKGRCHYHVQIQLAKKKLMGGWNVSTYASRMLCSGSKF
jgi:hypothetical protein